jgi:hypothetical protein
VFRNITLHVAHSYSCGPDDGRESTETCCPIELVHDTPVIGTKRVVFDGILNKLIQMLRFAPLFTPCFLFLGQGFSHTNTGDVQIGRMVSN